MVTTVGINPNFDSVLQSLLSLEYDAIAAYEASIERLEAIEYKQKISEFRQDHLRHIEQLSALMKRRGIDTPNGAGPKMVLTTGKVLFADLFGDKALLMAMKSNEEDTVKAYERAFNHKELTIEAKPIIEQGFADERRHRAWITDELMKMGDKAA